VQIKKWYQNMFRQVPIGATVTPIGTQAVTGGHNLRFATGDNNPNFELILCHNRIPQARINFRSHTLGLAPGQLVCAVPNALEVSLEGQIFERVSSLTRAGVGVPFAASRFSYNLDEVDTLNMPVRFARDCRVTADFSGRYLAVMSDKDCKVFDCLDTFRPIASQNIEVDSGSVMGIATDGTVFVSGGGRITAYRLTDGGYFEAGQIEANGVRRILVSSLNPIVVCVEAEDSVSFFGYTASGFSSLLTISSPNRTFFNQADGNIIQFFTPNGASGEFVGATHRVLMPEFASVLTNQELNVGRLAKVRVSRGVLLAERTDGSRFLVSARGTTPIPLPSLVGAVDVRIFGQYLLVEYSDRYEIFVISIATNRCVRVQTLDKGSGVRGVVQNGQWVVVLYADGSTRLFASRFDSLALIGSFGVGQVFIANAFARQNFRNNENVEIKLVISG